MARLIDADALAMEIAKAKRCIQSKNSDYLTGYVSALSGVEGQIAYQPTVEVVHGRWEWYTDRCEDLFLGCDDDYGWRCSKCKVPLDDEDDPEVMPTFRYCPNCGAKMDGDGNG